MSTEQEDRPDIAQLVTDAILSDGDWKEHYNDQIIDRYNGMDAAAKDSVDTIFALLCGWSLGTIIERHKQPIK